jgi:5-methylcytosine-specific restriction endonuclease McrA
VKKQKKNLIIKIALAIILATGQPFFLMGYSFMEKICVVCGSTFEPSKQNQKTTVTCSGKCNLKKWRRDNPLHNIAIKKNWRRKNGVTERGSQEHRFRMAELARGNKHRNKGGYENHLMHGRKRSKMISNANGWHSKLEWDSLKEKYNFSCVCCGDSEPLIKLTKDHIIPLTKGGGNSIDNIQPLCKYCNSRKHDKIINFLWQL